MTSRSTCLTSGSGTTRLNWLSRVFQLGRGHGGGLYKKVRTDDEYNEIRAKYGDSTSVDAQLAALRSLGLQAEFRKNGDADLVEQELEAGRPVLVGWLHAGNMLLGEPPMCNALSCGHWSVISGYAGKNSSDPEWIMQDPRGYPEMEKGGHSNRI